jgi:cell division protein FtsL
MANRAINRVFLDLIPDVVKIAFVAIIVVVIIVTVMWQIVAKYREKQVGKKVTTLENKGLLQSRQVGY